MVWPRRVHVADVSLQELVVRGAVSLQHRQVRVQRGEGLAHFIMELAADAFTLGFLHVQDLVGKIAQVFLHQGRFVKEQAVVVLAFPQGLFRPLASGDFPCQFAIGPGQGGIALGQGSV